MDNQKQQPETTTTTNKNNSKRKPAKAKSRKPAEAERQQNIKDIPLSLLVFAQSILWIGEWHPENHYSY